MGPLRYQIAVDGRSNVIVAAKRAAGLTWPGIADVLAVSVQTLRNQVRRHDRAPNGSSVTLCELILEGAPTRPGLEPTWSENLRDKIERARRNNPDRRGRWRDKRPPDGTGIIEAT